MAVLTRIQREFIVRKLGALWTPRDILPMLQAAFPDIKCTEQDVLKNDPQVVMLEPELARIYEEELEINRAKPPIYASQWARLKRLSNDIDYYYGNNQRIEAQRLIRQVAEECGAIGAGKTPQQSASEAPKVDRIIHEIVDSADE